MPYATCDFCVCTGDDVCLPLYTLEVSGPNGQGRTASLFGANLMYWAEACSAFAHATQSEALVPNNTWPITYRVVPRAARKPAHCAG